MTESNATTEAETPVRSDRLPLGTCQGDPLSPSISPDEANPSPVSGRFETDADGRRWYLITNYDYLDPFLINLVTADDQWAFISSSTALTAGRRQATNALFPYETDDRLHRCGGRSGPVTLIRIDSSSGRRVEPSGATWQPFAPTTPFDRVVRSIAKTVEGDKVRFVEHDPETGLSFTMTWAAAGTLGLARTCTLSLAPDTSPVELTILDGLIDILPAGVDLGTQQSSSTLVDAYRRSEFDPARRLALYTLEARVTDQADPAESLTANLVWSAGLPAPTLALSDRQLRRFSSGCSLASETLVTGRKGAFLQAASAVVTPDQPLKWVTVADVNASQAEVVARARRVAGFTNPLSAVGAEQDRSLAELRRIVAQADGIQLGADSRTTTHHFANVLFNTMRGGVFLDDHRVDVVDIADFIELRNRPLVDRFNRKATTLDPTATIDEVRAAVADDDDLARLVDCYLPLSFSRRHGDPSRPWNTFTIASANPDGSPARGYEGNWRDIFQNWEALTRSFPAYAQSVVTTFLSASTLDGHNPYRISDRGIDWERPEEGDWANFGYWGDHQIIYLHRLLINLEQFNPGQLSSALNQTRFSSADVPYRMVSYQRILADPKQTLTFDHDRQHQVETRVELLGADGRLVPGPDGDGVYLSTLGEKLLIPALAKISNLVAGAGTWLITQRPEWNDANNALVGNGVSVITARQLADYLTFVDQVLDRTDESELMMTQSIVNWALDLAAALEPDRVAVETDSLTPAQRRAQLDRVGLAAQTYRDRVYNRDYGPRQPIRVDALRRIIATFKPHLDHIARQARRPDGLVDTYVLLRLSDDEAHIEPLYEMLEGQVVALSSGSFDNDQALDLLDSLATSELFRADQNSYILYPNRRPGPFLAKAVIPPGEVGPAITALLQADPTNRIVVRDDEGTIRFASSVESARVLGELLDSAALDPHLAPFVTGPGRAELEATYQTVFNHRAFTGRSQTMYRYEGLGSIYWHMVSKLLLAVQERILNHPEAAAWLDGGELSPQLAHLISHYREIRQGLGPLKSPSDHGSFPFDPHSHTPAHTGAQQPGMTGQVKEGILLRAGELGIGVQQGCVSFRPVLLESAEFLSQSTPWAALGEGETLAPASLGFTYCAVPVVYHRGGHHPAPIRVTMADGTHRDFSGPLDRETSQALFSRLGLIDRIDVTINLPNSV